MNTQIYSYKNKTIRTNIWLYLYKNINMRQKIICIESSTNIFKYLSFSDTCTLMLILSCVIIFIYCQQCLVSDMNTCAIDWRLYKQRNLQFDWIRLERGGQGRTGKKADWLKRFLQWIHRMCRGRGPHTRASLLSSC